MGIELTDRQKIVLAAMAAESGAEFAPVQVQKMFFLIDETIAEEIGGRQFAFEPYDYGPFDKAVYQELEALERTGLLNVEQVAYYAGRRRYYSLTPLGQEEGTKALQALPSIASDYIAKLSPWVRSLSFAQLVGTIYNAYPHMRENSIFED